MTRSRNRSSASVWFWGIIALAAVMFSMSERVARRSELQRQTASLTAFGEGLLLDRSILDWTMMSGASEALARGSSRRPWVILLIGGTECSSCSKRRESLLRSLQAMPVLSRSSAIWFASPRPENPRPQPSGDPTTLTRFLRITDFGALRGTMRSLPIPVALMVDSAGVIRSVSVGYHDGIDAQWLERTPAPAPGPPVTPR